MRGRKTRHVSSRRAGDFIYLWWEEVLLSLPLWEEPFFQELVSLVLLALKKTLHDTVRHNTSVKNTKHRHTYFLLMSKKFEECIDLRFKHRHYLRINENPIYLWRAALFPFWELQQEFSFLAQFSSVLQEL